MKYLIQWRVLSSCRFGQDERSQLESAIRVAARMASRLGAQVTVVDMDTGRVVFRVFREEWFHHEGCQSETTDPVAMHDA